MKIAVYGTLRKGQNNHYILKDEKFLGTFESEPKFTMHSINNVFPSVINGGNTSIKIEVYDINPELIKKINVMEGYYEANKPSSMYIKYKMVTPYGIAAVYLYNKSTDDKKKVTNGDWVEYKELIKLTS